MYADQALPEPQSVDFLVVMGGPMNIYQEAEHPWLVGEKAFLDAFLALERPAIGVCLGAQLLADRLGGAVTKNPEPEIGWFEVQLTDEGKASPVFKGLPEHFTAFHWHGDTFAIPAGAVRAAQSEACANQAFVYEDRVLGLQYHMETTPEAMERLMQHAAGEITPGRIFIQTVQAMRRNAVQCRTMRPLLDRLLDNLTS